MMDGMQLSMRVGDISFGAAAAFLFGVFATNMGWNLWALGVIGLFSLAAIALFLRRTNLWKMAALVLSVAAAGTLYYFAFVHWEAARTHVPTGKQTALFAVVTEEPKLAGNFMMLVASLSRPYAGTVDIFTSPNSNQFHYGDEVWMQGTVTPSEDVGEPPAMFLPRLRVVAEHQGCWLKAMVIGFKDLIAQKIVQLLPADQASLLAGILIGTTGTVSAALKAQMEASGTTYIVNMYGYKIAIITAALAVALKDRVPRKLLLWLTLAVIALFVFASGGAISAVRAAIMGSFAVVARGTGRVFSARNAITFSAVGMVALNATLLTDAGFQLSFLSFLGIYYLGPPINNYFHWTDGGALQWKEHAMLSLTTNLAILPVAMNTFGGFSLTSLVSNILIMIPWLAVIALGTLAVALAWVSPILAFGVVRIVSVLLQYELFIIRVFSAITVDLPMVFGSALVIALYYGILIVFAHYYAAPSQKDN
jgi:ComEC/Rec2-related protein